MMDRCLPLASGGVMRVRTSTIDPDVAIVELPRFATGLVPDEAEWLRDALTEHLIPFYARQPPSMSLFESEPF